jgi:hypothetical protein
MPSIRRPPQRVIQLTLFRACRNEPSWDAVPLEIQQQVLQLLARMFRGHLARQHGEMAAREDRDE